MQIPLKLLHLNPNTALNQEAVNTHARIHTHTYVHLSKEKQAERKQRILTKIQTVIKYIAARKKRERERDRGNERKCIKD